MHTLPPLDEFIALVQRADADAAVRIPLLEAAAPHLYQAQPLPSDRALPLADKFERWRYQVLNKYSPHLSDDQKRMVTAVDASFARLRQDARPPRMPRGALATDADERIQEVLSRLSKFLVLPLPDLLAQARQATLKHFPPLRTQAAQWRMALYAPLYLSNHCINHCLYCAFRFPNQQPRVQLNLAEVRSQADVLEQMGFRHLLLVASDFPRLTSPAYFCEIAAALKARGLDLAVEIAAQSTLNYQHLRQAGVEGVTLYQETYDEAEYARHHPLGTKVWYDWRLEAPERAAEAGMNRLGLGILLGLAQPERDLRALVAHAAYLQVRFPRVQLSFSLPRIHEAPAPFTPVCHIHDDDLVRFYCALRLVFPAANLVLSTRESPSLRDRLAMACITQMSAGSCTAPGGYGQTDADRLEQFPVHDSRSTLEMSQWLTQAGFEVHWTWAS